MKYLIVMLVLISSYVASAEKSSNRLNVLRLNPNRFFFLAIDDGVKGKFAASGGLRPVLVFANGGEDVEYLIVEPVAKTEKSDEGYNFYISTDEKVTDDDMKIFVPYDRKARIAKVAKQRNYANPAPEVVVLSGIQYASIPVCSVASEIYSISLFESDSLENLKKLPVSPLFPLFEWPKGESDVLPCR